VHVAQVQDAQRLGICGQDRDVEVPQGEQVALDQAAVGERGRSGADAGARDRPGRPEDSAGTGAHGTHVTVAVVPELKARLQSDLSAAMKARDELTTATLRMVLTAVTTEEVAGKQARELSDDEVVRVLQREAKKRREAAEAYDQAGRPELSEREQAEGGVIERYLPAQLSDDELAALVREAVAGLDAPNMGAVMKAVQPRVAGRADGRRVSEEVRRQLA
jgi:uncharacterized protein YqeY